MLRVRMSGGTKCLARELGEGAFCEHDQSSQGKESIDLGIVSCSQSAIQYGNDADEGVQKIVYHRVPIAHVVL